MLAFMGQQPAWNSLNQSFNSNAAQNSTVTTPTINTMLCPSDGNTPPDSISGEVYASGNDVNNIGTVRSLNGGRFEIRDPDNCPAVLSSRSEKNPRVWMVRRARDRSQRETTVILPVSSRTA
jgi:hypothetical protein